MLMMTKCVTSLYARAGFVAALVLLLASPAAAQFRPRPLNDSATAEKYHIEGAVNLWYPTADIFISSESLGIVGTKIDAKQDLGLKDQRFPDLRLVLKPATKHKFRLQYIPILYVQTAAPSRAIVFNGQRYPVSISVDSTLDWKAYRLGYEYDFVTNNRGFGGFIVEAKYTDVRIALKSTTLNLNEFARARAPIPAIGGIARVYVVPNISLTGEITGFKFPENLIKGDSAHYFDFDVYGTLNFTNYIGLQVGYRNLDVGYVIKADAGTFTLKGPYFGVVARY